MKNGRLIFSLIILFFIGLTSALYFVIPANIYFRIFRPAAYLVLAIATTAYFGLRFGYNRYKKPATTILLFGTVIYLALLFLSGLIAGLSKNPMVPSLSVFMQNVWTYIPFVILGEIIRFQLVKTAHEKHKTLLTTLIIILFSFAMLENLNGLSGASATRWVEFIMTALLPTIILNFFLTYVCQSGSLVGTVAFRFAYSLLPVFSPYLPSITKIFFVILGYTAVIVMFFIYDKYTHDDKQKTSIIKKQYGWRGYIVPALIVVLCLIVGSGFLPSGPVAVASNSMKGEFSKGDLLIVKRIDEQTAKETLQVGDIILFHDRNMEIIHRIIEIQEDYKGDIEYVTKGDNNPLPDSAAVSPSQVLGIATFKIKYIGYPSVLLKELIAS